MDLVESPQPREIASPFPQRHRAPARARQLTRRHPHVDGREQSVPGGVDGGRGGAGVGVGGEVFEEGRAVREVDAGEGGGWRGGVSEVREERGEEGPWSASGERWVLVRIMRTLAAV